jgi:hypothetical protein
MSNIVVAQYWTNNIAYSKYTEAINKKYCEEKGYVYYTEKNSEKIYGALEGRAVTWYKPKLILEVFETFNPEYVLFLDADAIVCDSDYRIEDFIIPNKYVVCTEDYGPSKINAGVFIFKNNKWTVDLLKKWWESCDIFPGGPNNVVGYYANALWHDQTCFGKLIELIPDYSDKISIIENKVLNGRVYKDSQHKNFIFHAFSYGLVKNRTIDMAYYDIFNLEKPKEDIDLTELAANYYTDKQYEHNYFSLVYTDLFSSIKDDVKSFVEIGMDKGESLLLWRDYFTEANIIGADIDISRARDRKSVV